MKPLAYIAGPYTNPDPVLNTRRAVEVADALIAEGYAVIVPHLTMLWHLVSPKSLDEWYSIDLDLLAHADLLVRIPGPSSGADVEVAFAREHGIEIRELT